MISKHLEDLAKITDQIDVWQNNDGSIKPDHVVGAETELLHVSALVKEICHSIQQRSMGDAIALDISSWIMKGLTNKPSFSNTVRAFRAPSHGEKSFFWGPLRLANAGNNRGFFVRSFLSHCEVPVEIRTLEEMYPHPKNVCQPTHLIWGTRDLVDGNNVVFFPENIACANSVLEQKYAAFFFNKHYGLYRDITLPAARALLAPGREFFSSSLDRQQTYTARCVWGYLHDYFHHQGPRPFDTNIQTKIKRSTGLLEETKVDLQSYLVCQQDNIPYGREVAEFIILERLFRYPQEPDYETNFDAGTGLFALSYFIAHGAISVENNRFRFSAHFDEAVSHLISEIEEIENIDDDEVYVAAAQAKVNQYLPVTADHKKYVAPQSVTRSPIGPFLGRGGIQKNLHLVGNTGFSSFQRSP